MGLKVMMRLVQGEFFQNEARKDGSTQISRETGRRRAIIMLHCTTSGSRVVGKLHELVQECYNGMHFLAVTMIIASEEARDRHRHRQLTNLNTYARPFN